MNLKDIVSSIEELQKAIATTPVSGLELVREDLQAEMAIAAPTDAPLRNRLARIQGAGKAHAWYRLKSTLDSTTGALFLGTGPHAGFFPKGGLPVQNPNQYEYVSAPYTSLGDLVEVTFFDQMAGATYTDIRQHQIKVKMINLALMEEWTIINGDSSVVLSSGGQMFDGLLKQTTENVVDSLGAPLALHDINAVQQLIVTQGGKPQALVLSYRDQLKFNELVLGSYYRLMQAGAGALADIPSGVNITKWIGPFGTVDVIGDRYLAPGYGNVSTALVLDDKTIMQDGNAIQMVDLMPVSAVDLAIVQTSYKTVVCEFTVLQVTSPVFQGKILNIGS